MRRPPSSTRSYTLLPSTTLFRALDVGGPCLEARHVCLLELQLCRVLDGQDALAPVDEGGHGVQHGGLAAAGAAGDQHVAARLDDTHQKVGGRLDRKSTRLNSSH